MHYKESHVVPQLWALGFGPTVLGCATEKGQREGKRFCGAATWPQTILCLSAFSKQLLEVSVPGTALWEGGRRLNPGPFPQIAPITALYPTIPPFPQPAPPRQPFTFIFPKCDTATGQGCEKGKSPEPLHSHPASPHVALDARNHPKPV